MFNDSILEKIFSHEEMQRIPVGCQSTAVHVFEEVLEDILEVSPYGSISDLFISAAPDDGVSAEFQSEYADADPLYG